MSRGLGDVYKRQDLQGIGYGSTMEEAKQEALSDLSASVKVQVYSKHEQTTYKNKNKIKSDYTHKAFNKCASA